MDKNIIYRKNNTKIIMPENKSKRGALIDAVFAEYHSLFLIREDDTYEALRIPEEYETIVNKMTLFSQGVKAYCRYFVNRSDRNRIEKFASIDNVRKCLQDKKTIVNIYKTTDGGWKGAKFIDISFDDENNKGRQYLLGIIDYDIEMQNEQNQIMINRIVSTLSDSYQIIYRVNLDNGEYECILNNAEVSFFNAFSMNFFMEEEHFRKEHIDKVFGPQFDVTTGPQKIKNKFLAGEKQIVFYNKEINGGWLKVTISPEEDFSDSKPYVIYAIRKCVDEMSHITTDIINKTSLSKMYSLAVVFDVETASYSCIHNDQFLRIKKESSISDFISQLQRRIYEEDIQLIKNLIYDAPEDGSKFKEREFRAEDEMGMVHFFGAFSTVINVPEGKKVLLLVRNIDDQVANNARLTSLNRNFDMTKNVMYALGDAYFGIFYCNMETNRLIAVRSLEDAKQVFRTSFSYDEIFKNYVEKLIHPNDRERILKFVSRENIQKELMYEGMRCYCEYQRLFVNKYKFVRMDIQAIKFKDGKVYEFVMALKDIHDERENEIRYQKEMQEALKAANMANEAKSSFLSNMSHDMRTPMNAVIGLTGIALSHLDDDRQVKNCLEKINQAGNHLLELINGVLDMSYIESGKIVLNNDEIFLPDLIHNIVQIIQFQIMNKQITFNVKAVDIKNEYVRGDKVRINQVLMNILGNAVKYSYEGGKILFEIRQDRNYVFTIKDNGPGMKKEFLNRIFQPFERENDTTASKIEGTGLGMTITKNLVDKMGGNISVNSMEGEGTEVIIEIPLEPETAREVPDVNNELGKYRVIEYNSINDSLIDRIKECAEMKPSMPVAVVGTYSLGDLENDARSAGMDRFMLAPVFFSDFNEKGHSEERIHYDFMGCKILVVDDNEINREIVCDLLEDVNCAYGVAENGKEAFDIISTDTEYDAVLMDVMMPVMDGCEAAEKIRQLGTDYAKHLPIIAMTANAFAEDRLKTKQAGMNEHISKPVNPDVLYKVLFEFLSPNSDTK